MLDLDRLDRDAIMDVDPLQLLFARGNAALVRDVVVDGQTIVREGKKFGAGPGARKACSAMGELHQAHLADHVLVECEAVDADRDGTAAAVRGGDRREAGMQMQVGREIGYDARA